MCDETPTETPTPARCGSPTKAGGVCPLRAVEADGRCTTHSELPEVVEARLAAQRAGIAAKKESERTGPLAVSELSQELLAATEPVALARVAAKVASAVATGALMPKQGQVITAALNAALAAYRADLGDRLKKIEEIANRHPETRAAWRRRKN